MGSPKKFWSRKFKTCPKIQRFEVNNFRASGSILTGLFSVDVRWGRGDKVGTIFTRPAPRNLWRPKYVQNSARFLTTFDFDHEYLRNGSTYRTSEELLKIYNPSHVGRKKFVYFGPQTKKLLTLIYLHPNGLFSGNYILALRGCCPLKFLHALQIDQGYLAHTPR